MIMGHVGDTVYSFFARAKAHIPGHVGDTAFLPGQKTHITTFGAPCGLAFDATYNIKQANLSERKMYVKQITIWKFSYHTPYQPETPISARGPKTRGLIWAKAHIPGHVGDTAFLPGQKTHITTFGAPCSLAFDATYNITYNIKQANLSERKMYVKQIMIWKFSYHSPYQPETPISARGPKTRGLIWVGD